MITWILPGLLVGFPLSALPGATIVVTIREVGRRGRSAGLFAAAGRAAADLVFLAALALLVLPRRPLFAGEGGLALSVGLVGALCLGLLGSRLMGHRAVGALHRDRGGVLLRAWHANAVLDRFLAALLNPFRLLFWATAGLRLVVGAAGEGWIGVVAFAAGFLAAGLSWPSFVAIRLADGRRERALSDRQYRIITSLGGLALVGVGFLLLVRTAASSGLREVLERSVAAVFGTP